MNLRRVRRTVSHHLPHHPARHRRASASSTPPDPHPDGYGRAHPRRPQAAGPPPVPQSHPPPAQHSSADNSNSPAPTPRRLLPWRQAPPSTAQSAPPAPSPHHPL